MTKEQKIEAYTMLLNGNTYETVARHFGVSRQYINRMFPHASAVKRMDGTKCVYPAIFEFMAANGMTCLSLAKKVGVSPNALCTVLSGGHDPSKKTIDKILAETGLTYEAAFRKKDNSDG